MSKVQESLNKFNQASDEEIPEDSHNQYNEDFENDQSHQQEEKEAQNKNEDEAEDQYNQEEFDLDDNQNDKQQQSQNEVEKSKDNLSISSKRSQKQSKQDIQQVEQISNKALPKVEYRKNNYLIYLREISGGKFVQQKERARQINDSNQLKTLVYYRFGDKNWIEGKLRTMIEVPFERNQTEEEIEFKLITIDEDAEVQVKQKFKLHELNLTKENPYDTFTCRFDSRKSGEQKSTYIKFALIFDATILSYVEDQSEQTLQILKDKKNQQAKKLGIQQQQPGKNVILLSFTLKEIEKYNEFIKQRRQNLRDQMILTTSTNWSCRYLLQIQLAKQKCQVYLDDPERDDLYLFYTRNMGQVTVQLLEQIYETFQLDNYGQITYKETKLKSESPLGKPIDISVEDLIQKGKGYQLFNEAFDQILQTNFTISMIPEKTQFHNKFLGFTSIKILETVVFNETQSPTHMEISLYSMDNELINQVWRLKPFAHYSQNVQKISTWDYQHDLVYKKNFQDAEENVDVMIPEELFKKILQDESQKSVTKLEGDFPIDEDFKIYIKNYQHLMSYEPILVDSKGDYKDLNFSQKNNHIFFKTTCPFDYISIKLYSGDYRKSENLIGVYEESFFKVPENNLILGYIYLDKDGRVESNYNQVEAKNKLSSNKQDILDNDKNDNIIGTIKFSIDHFGYNKFLIEDSVTWVKEIINYKEDSDQLVSEIKSSIKNVITKQQQLQVLRLSLSEIWNLIDLVEQVIPQSTLSEQFDLRIKLGTICYTIRLVVNRFDKKSFKKQDILYKLEKENSRCYFERINDKFYSYSKTEDYVIQITVDTDISSSLIFQITSSLESLIIELRTISKNDEVLAFCSEQIKNIYFFNAEGFIILPLSIPDINKRYANNKYTKDNSQKLDFFNNTVYFKFNFDFIEVDNFNQTPQDNSAGLYTLGLYIPPQQKLTKDKQKLLKQFVYQLNIHEINSDKKFEKNINFSSIIPKFTIDYFKNFEFNRQGDLFFLVKIKKVYSGDLEEDDEDNEYIFQKQYHINFNYSTSQENYNKDIKLEKLKLKLNSFEQIVCSFYDETINQKLSLTLQVNYKYNYFIEYPQQLITVCIPFGLEQKMITSDIIDSNYSLTLKLSSLSREALKYKKNSQEHVIGFGSKKKSQEQEYTFESFDFRDSLVLQIFSDTDLMETSIIKISDLILLDASKSQEDYSIQQIEAGDSESVNNQSQISISKKKMLTQKQQMQPPSSDYLWTFIIFSNKKFEFFIKMKDRVPRAEKSVLIKQEQSVAHSKKDLSMNKGGAKTASQSVLKEEKKEYDLYTIKKMIQDKQKENQLLSTELQKTQKEIIKQENAIKELEDIQKRSNAKAMDSQKPKRTTAPIQLSEEANKAKILFQSICQCGAPSPKYKGFCENCVEEMKNEYKKKYDEYKIIADKYETLYIKNINTDTKIIKMKKKIESLQKEAAFMDSEQTNEQNGDEKLLLDEINFIKQNIKLTQAEIKMMQNENQRVINEKYHLQNSLEEKIAKKIQKITKLNQEASEFKKRREDLEEKIDSINKKYAQQRENI
ncbi:hypothetical protein ABPG74_015149 [Tetrahymena malaccensis]